MARRRNAGYHSQAGATATVPTAPKAPTIDNGLPMIPPASRDFWTGVVKLLTISPPQANLVR
jgi:hypothetical protein